MSDRIRGPDGRISRARPARQRPAASNAAARAVPKVSAPKSSALKRRNGAGSLGLGVLDGHLGYYLRRAQIWIFQDFIRTLEGPDLRPAEFSVLAVIGGNKDYRKPTWRNGSALSGARLVRLLDRLEKRGFTQRRPHPPTGVRTS